MKKLNKNDNYIIITKKMKFSYSNIWKISKDFIYRNLVFYILNAKIIKFDGIIVSNSNELLFNK